MPPTPTPPGLPEPLVPGCVRVCGDPRLRTDSEILALVHPSAETLCTVEESGVLRHWHADGTLRGWWFLSRLETLWRFSRDGRFLFSAGRDLCVWDVRSGTLLAAHTQPKWITSLAFRGDGVCQATDLVLATGDESGALRVWTRGGERLIRSFAGHPQALSALAFSPEGARLASAAEDRTVCVWDLPTGRVLWQSAAHTDRIVDLAWHPNGRHLVSASWDGTLQVWDPNSGESVRLTGSCPNPVNVIALSVDGQWLAAADAGGLVRVWNWPGLTPEHTSNLGVEITALAFSPSGTALATAGADRLVRILCMGEQFPPPGSRAFPSAFALSGFRRNGNALALVGRDRLAEIGARTHVRLWSDSAEPAQLKLDAPTALHAVAGSRDGRLVAAGGETGQVGLWDAKTGSLLETLETASGGEPLTALAFSPDNSTLAAASACGTFLHLWHLGSLHSSWMFANALDGCTIESVAFSPCGRYLGAGGIDWMATGGSDGLALVWALRDWNEVGAFEDGSTAVAFHPSGHWLATAGLDATVRIWDIKKSALAQTLAGPRAIMTGLAFSPDGRRLATGGDDRFLRIWDADRGELCLQAELDSEIKTLTYSTDGRFLFTAQANGASYQFDVAQLKPSSP